VRYRYPGDLGYLGIPRDDPDLDTDIRNVVLMGYGHSGGLRDYCVTSTPLLTAAPCWCRYHCLTCVTYVTAVLKLVLIPCRDPHDVWELPTSDPMGSESLRDLSP
jgi:hypothetical protein